MQRLELLIGRLDLPICLSDGMVGLWLWWRGRQRLTFKQSVKLETRIKIVPHKVTQTAREDVTLLAQTIDHAVE
jgi:hypothetical protein